MRILIKLLPQKMLRSHFLMMIFLKNPKHSKSDSKIDSFYLAWRKRISNMRNSKSDTFGKSPCNDNYQSLTSTSNLKKGSNTSYCNIHFLKNALLIKVTFSIK